MTLLLRYWVLSWHVPQWAIPETWGCCTIMSWHLLSITSSTAPWNSFLIALNIFLYHISKEHPEIAQRKCASSITGKWLKFVWGVTSQAQSSTEDAMEFGLTFLWCITQCYDRTRRSHICWCLKEDIWQSYIYVQHTPSHPGLKGGR